jgi:ankyrin repeat protein
LEAVKIAVEQGADVNLVNTDGRTALDAAKALRFQSVVDYLTAKGAKPGVPGAKSNDRPSRDAGRGGGRGQTAPPTQEPAR